MKTAITLLFLSCLCACGQIGGLRSPVSVGNLHPNGPTLKDSWTGAVSANLECAHFAGTTFAAVNFTAGSSYTLTQLKLTLSKTGARASGLKAAIYSATTGGFPNPKPNVEIGGTADVTVADADIGTSAAVVTITGFNCAIVSGTTYFIHFQDLNGPFTGDWFKLHQVTGTSVVNAISADDSIWGSNATTEQLWFETYQ